MSFMSGIMMGAAIGRNIHDMMTMKKGLKGDICPVKSRMHRQSAGVVIEAFSLESGIRGRRRYRMAALLDNVPLAVLLEKNLIRIKYISEVKANPATGSLLIVYSREHEKDLDELAEKLRQRVANVNVNEDSIEQSDTDKEKSKAQPTLYAKSWHGTGNFLNAQVRRLTGGCFDISALVSMIFLIRGLRKILIYGDRPNGTSMIWWALHLMKGWKS